MSSTSEVDEIADGDRAERDDVEGPAAVPEMDAEVALYSMRCEESCEHCRTMSKRGFARLATSALCIASFSSLDCAVRST
jgi:hypothetical protein